MNEYREWLVTWYDKADGAWSHEVHSPAEAVHFRRLSGERVRDMRLWHRSTKRPGPDWTEAMWPEAQVYAPRHAVRPLASSSVGLLERLRLA